MGLEGSDALLVEIFSIRGKFSMSNRPVKKKKQVVEITQEDFDVEWTPPPRTARDRIIQFGVLFLIICFLLPAVTCAVVPEPEVPENVQQMQQDPIAKFIKQYSDELAKNPGDPAALANLGYYTTIKAMTAPEDKRNELFATGEKYLRDSLEKDPDYAFATSELARNLLLQKKTEEANTLINEALEKVEPKLASEDEKEANDAKSRKVDLLLLAAGADSEAKDNQAALDKMNQALELRPGDTNLYFARASVHMALEDKEAARKDLTTAVDIGTKMGDQQAVVRGQQMIEALDAPPKLEVIDMKETDLTVSPTPAAE